MKNAFIIFLAALSLLLVSPAADSLGTATLTDHPRVPSITNPMDAGQSPAGTNDTKDAWPISLLLLTGFFGIAFWGRSDLKPSARDGV